MKSYKEYDYSIGSLLGAIMLGGASADAIFPTNGNAVVIGAFIGFLFWAGLMVFKLRV